MSIVQHKRLTDPVIMDQLIPEIKEWPIYRMHQDRDEFVEELIEAAMKRLLNKYDGKYKDLIANSLYQERIRVKEEPWKADPPNERQYLQKINNSLKKYAKEGYATDDPVYEELLRRVVHRYAEEIVGGFKIKTFKLARRVSNALFNRLLVGLAGRHNRLKPHLRIHGDMELIRSLYQHGTVLLTPTHSSNLDSILIGYAIDRFAGLPAKIYGAGLNLYDSEFFSYFFNRLGAYRVDRRKKNPIYLETLKAMSERALMRGVHSIFFPGGTRSRSGTIEQKLKLGLLGTAIEAQQDLIATNRPEKIFILPLVLSYHCVLEADYLIDQHLRKTGRERYFRSKDKGGTFQILRFLWRIFSSDSDILLSFGQPMDVLGNPVDALGRSIRGDRELSIADYFSEGDGLVRDEQRDRVYTRTLDEALSERYLKDNILLSSHAVAYCAFQYLRLKEPDMDVYELIRLPEDEVIIDHKILIGLIAQLQEVLHRMEQAGEILLTQSLYLSPEELLQTGIQKLGVFHPMHPLAINADGHVVSESFKLLYFYHNRLSTYALDDALYWPETDYEA